MLVGGLAVVVVLALAVGLVGIPLYHKLFAPSPTERVLAAAAEVAAADAVHLTGGLSVDETDTQQTVDLTVDVKGRAYGTVRRAGGRADVVSDGDGNTYVRGDRRWVLATDPARAGYLVGKWATAGSGLTVLPSKLSPTDLAAYLKAGLRADDPRHAAVDADPAYPRSVHGTAVTPLRLPGGGVAYVTADEPYRLVAVDGGVGAADTAHVAFDVTHVRKSAFDKGIAGYGGVDRDRDPVAPARYEVGKAGNGYCDESSCSESGTVKADGGDTTRRGHLVGLFSTDKAGKHAFATCTAKLPAIRPNHSAKVTCSADPDEWRAWTATSPDPHFWVFLLPLSGGYDDDPKLVLDLLRSNRLSTYGALAGGDAVDSTAALDLVNRLGKRHGWTGDAAVEAVAQLAESGALGVVQPLVAGDHLTLDAETFNARFRPTDLPRYDEAARRVAGGTGRVAIGPWTDSDGSTYEGDVFDLTGKRVVTVTDLGGTGRGAVRAAVVGGARDARSAKVPAGFGRDLRLVAGASSPLYRVGRGDVRAALRDAGVRRKDLAGLTAIVVGTGGGTVTLHPADFA